MRHMRYAAVVFCLLAGLPVAAKQGRVAPLTFNVTDQRPVIYRDISENLRLRVIRDEIGWVVEVARKPIKSNAAWNLLYHSLKWHGPYPSEIYAWHVADHYFSNVRALYVRGHPYYLRITLLNPVVAGTGPEAKFMNGTIKIAWWRRPRNTHT